MKCLVGGLQTAPVRLHLGFQPIKEGFIDFKGFLPMLAFVLLLH